MIFYSLTDIGKRRENNEDSYFSQIKEYNGVKVGIFAIADGMGGYENGEYASKKSIELVVNYIDESFNKVNLSNTSDDEIKKISKQAINIANNVIYKQSAENSPMGTTFVMGVIINEKLFVANVGDSRAYMLSNGNFNQITKDNSVVQEMIEEGLLDEKNAEIFGKKNEITRAVGYDKSVEVDFYVREIQQDDKILMCSDGLTTMIDDEQIKSILEVDKKLEEICMELVFLANTNGGRDNITVTVIEMK